MYRAPESSEYLQIPYVAGVGELSVYCAAMVALDWAFLWFNPIRRKCSWADMGSAFAGRGAGIVAVNDQKRSATDQSSAAFRSGSVLVIFQVISYKFRRKRIFLMAPIHHHYELKAWAGAADHRTLWIISFIAR